MDNIDQKLIAALRRDSRSPLSDLAGLLGISRATVRARLEKLQSSGDIQGFTVLTRQDVAQSPVRGLMMLKIEGAGAERILHRLTGYPQVTEVHSTNGAWDLIAEIGTGTLEEFDRILFEIRRLDGVTSSETNLLLSTRKSKRI
ncbi:MAG: Lrp/AsnC family transcriptional regulator [Rhodobacter sp.]|nr:Lrp/AsnC family transcriptional regulator [Rhodobacter sp.]